MKYIFTIMLGKNEQYFVTDLTVTAYAGLQSMSARAVQATASSGNHWLSGPRY